MDFNLGMSEDQVKAVKGDGKKTMEDMEGMMDYGPTTFSYDKQHLVIGVSGEAWK